MSQKSVEIIPGVFMPMMGLGTFRITEPSRVHLAVDAALSCGYRMLDTAAVYQNEVEIGVALDQLLPKHQLARTDLFVTTKLQSTSMGGDGKTTEGFRLSLDKLRLDYVDLYLIHYPKAEWLEKTDTKNRAIREATWREMEEILGYGNHRIH